MTTLQDLSEERQLNILRSIVLCDVGEKESLREENDALKEQIRYCESVFKYYSSCYACGKKGVVASAHEICKCGTDPLLRCEKCSFHRRKCCTCNTKTTIVEKYKFEK